MTSVPIAARCWEASDQTKILSFPWGTNVGWPLREIGVSVTGIDRLRGRFRAGTPFSPTHLLYFVVDGEVCAVSGRTRINLAKNHWAVFPAGIPHWIQHRRGSSEAVWVHLLDLPRWSGLKEAGLRVSLLESTRTLHEALLGAIAEAESSHFGSYENAMAYTTIFRNLLMRELRSSHPEGEKKIRKRLAGLWSEVNEHLAATWNVRTLARQVHMSERALYQKVASCHGLSPMQMVTRLRIERAKDLLLHSDDTVQGIAEAVGYQTAFALSDVFLRHTGRRPGEFRKHGRRSVCDGAENFRAQ